MEKKSESHELEDAITDFKSFAESVGPQGIGVTTNYSWISGIRPPVAFYMLWNQIKGLSYIVNTKVHLARRAFWTMVFVLGITQSILMMIGNGQRFYKVLRDLKTSSHFTLVPLYDKVDGSGQCRVPKSHHLPELNAL